MRKWTGYAAAMVLVCLHSAATAHAQNWVDTLRAARANYHDTDGNQITIGRWGDSITWSDQRYMVQLRDPGGTFQTTPETAAPMAWLNVGMRSDSWGWQWSNGDYANQCWRHGDAPGMAAASAVALSTFADASPGQKNYQYWLQHDNPEIALIMFGSNDMALYAGSGDAQYSPASTQANLREIVVACLANGTLPILSTIPPHDGYDNSSTSPANKALARQYYQAVVDLAAEEHVPLIDYYTEVVTRRPGDDWDGQANGKTGNDVEYSLISDGIHPSWPWGWLPQEATRTSFGEYALGHNGNTLHSYLGLLASYDAYEAAIATDAARTWAVPAGAWLDANSWGNRAPASYHIARIGNGGAATISQPGASCLQLLIGADANESGTVNLVTGGSLTVGDKVRIGSAGALNLQGGSLLRGGTDGNQGVPVESDGQFHVAGGSWTVGSVNGLDANLRRGATQVDEAATLTATRIRQDSLITGGTVQIRGSAGTTSDLNTLSIVGSTNHWTGAVDIGSSYLIVRSGDLATITNQIKNGLNTGHGYWDGNGITSSTAAKDSTFLTAVGVAQAGYLGLTEFGDANKLTGSEILVRYTWYGDADLSGSVDYDTDYNLWAGGFFNGYAGWQNGDFNHDGVVDYDNDYNLWAGSFFNQTVLPSAFGAIPEPGTLAMLALGGLVLARRRRRAWGAKRGRCRD